MKNTSDLLRTFYKKQSEGNPITWELLSLHMGETFTKEFIDELFPNHNFSNSAHYNGFEISSHPNGKSFVIRENE